MSLPSSLALAAEQFDRGVALENRHDLLGARLAYEAAIEHDPGHVEALASLAWLDVQAGDRALASERGERALALDPGNILARMALATADVQDRRLGEAGARLASLYADPRLTPLNRSIVLGLIGDLNDALGDPARAFKAYDAGNRQLQALYAGAGSLGATSALDHARRLAAWFEKADRAPWQHSPPAVPDSSEPRRHVFLLGFPRSGTTLLENVLAAHPDVIALEEKDSLAEAVSTFFVPEEGLERLGNIASEEAREQRAAYWAAVRSFGVEPEGRVFIDKMPLATVLLPLIGKLFPDAKILFAIRDPRDVVLSCFRRRFGMNAAMAQFLSLEGAATYYDAVMRLAEVYRPVLSVREHMVRHEDVVASFEPTMRAVCDFIGLGWTPAMADIAATARSRAISTPSAAQLVRGLNRDGEGAWRPYREQMAPVLPMLEPWVQRFGYDAA